MAQPLDGLLVVERAGRIACAVCANLLASLGAQVVRIETGATSQPVDAGSHAYRTLVAAGKIRWRFDPDDAASVAEWERLVRTADVVIVDRPGNDSADRDAVVALLEQEPGARVICAISPLGLEAAEELPPGAGEVLFQASSGIMATTGEEGGAPECVNAPIAEMCTAVASASAILAAVRVRETSGAGQHIDMSIVEVMADQLRTHMPLIMAGKTRGYRMGSQHPSCCPWNAYAARDGWVLVCSASDQQWHALLDVVGEPQLKLDARLGTNLQRRERGEVVNGVLARWIAPRTVAAVTAAIERAGVPVGPVLDIPRVLADPLLRARGIVREIPSADGTRILVPGSVLKLSRTPAVAPTVVAPLADTPPTVRERSTPSGVTAGAVEAPLAGVRVVELSRYTAGPLTGRILASLGAEVVKVEPPEGEDCRAWTPRFSDVSGFFANYNIGKRSLALDLRSQDGRAALWQVIGQADIVLQNFKAGALARMGFGHAAVLERFPRVIYASISGYGDSGPRLPALDTVLQGRAGLTSLIGRSGGQPLRVGVSIADVLAGQFAALGLLAALRERARSGRGQSVDISMCDAIAWLTQLAWPDGTPAIGPWCVLHTLDGWVAAQATRADAQWALQDLDPARNIAASTVERLRAAGLSACKVLELDEVLAQKAHVKRATLRRIETGAGEAIPVLQVPYRLRATPPDCGRFVAPLGSDNDAILGRAAAAAIQAKASQ